MGIFKKVTVFCMMILLAFGTAACVNPVEEQKLEILNAAADTLTLPSETETDLTLPLSVDTDISVAWASGNTAAITAAGKVTRAATDISVTMTATLTYSEKSITKDFTVKVKALAEEEEKTVAEKLSEAKTALELTGTDAVISSVALPSSGLNDTTITWVSAKTAVIGNNGTVVKTPLYDETVTFTATISIGSESVTKDFSITVKERDKSLFKADFKDGNDNTLIEFNLSGDATVGTVEENDDFTVTVNGGAMTRFGEYRSTWVNNVSRGIEIYLDPADIEDDEYFVWSCALNGTTGAYTTELPVYFMKVDGKLKVSTERIAANVYGYYGVTEADIIGAVEHENAVTVTDAGWYTIVTKFFEEEDNVFGQASLIKNSDYSVVYNATRAMYRKVSGQDNTYEDLPADETGGNRYGWFCMNNVVNGLKVKSLWMGVN